MDDCRSSGQSRDDHRSKGTKVPEALHQRMVGAGGPRNGNTGAPLSLFGSLMFATSLGSISGETKLSCCKARLLLTCPCAEASLLHYHQMAALRGGESTRMQGALRHFSFAFCGLDWRTQTTTKLAALLACWLWSWSAFVRARMHPRLRLATTWENVCSSESDGAHKDCTLICTLRLGEGEHTGSGC